MYVMTLAKAVDVTELLLCIKLRISFCFAYLVQGLHVRSMRSKVLSLKIKVKMRLKEIALP